MKNLEQDHLIVNFDNGKYCIAVVLDSQYRNEKSYSNITKQLNSEEDAKKIWNIITEPMHNKSHPDTPTGQMIGSMKINNIWHDLYYRPQRQLIAVIVENSDGVLLRDIEFCYEWLLDYGYDFNKMEKDNITSFITATWILTKLLPEIKTKSQFRDRYGNIIV